MFMISGMTWSAMLTLLLLILTGWGVAIRIRSAGRSAPRGVRNAGDLPVCGRCGYAVRGIIGKGGLREGSVEAMQRCGACYFAIVGGAAALETTQIEALEAVYWEDLMPECIWQFRFKGLGPLTVAIDSHGRNLYDDVKQSAIKRMAAVYKDLGL